MTTMDEFSAAVPASRQALRALAGLTLAFALGWLLIASPTRTEPAPVGDCYAGDRICQLAASATRYLGH